MSRFQPVAKSGLQKKFNQLYKKDFAPNPYSYIEASCLILEAYDFERIMDGDFPDEVAPYLENNPGCVVVKILMANEQIYYLPLEESLDQVYSTYGNTPLIKGLNGKVHYRNHDINTGTVIPVRQHKNGALHQNHASFVADIGGIIHGV